MADQQIEPRRKLTDLLRSVLGLGLFVLALFVIQRLLHKYPYQQIVQDLRQIPQWRLWAALALAGLSYVVMTGYDALAFGLIGGCLPYRKIALASFTGYAFSNNVGLSLIAGGSIRYRLYSAWEISGLEITTIVVFSTLTFLLGSLTLVGGLLVYEPTAFPGLTVVSGRVTGAVILALVFGYILVCSLRRFPINIRGWEFPVPSSRTAILQVVLSSVDWIIAATVLYVLLPTDAASLPYFRFLVVYLVAQFTGYVSNVPGGLGVFESIILLMFPSSVPQGAIMASLLVYRVVYYFVPLVVAAALLAVYEVLARRHQLVWIQQWLGRWAPEVVPQVYAFLTFVGGAIMLIGRATPIAKGQMDLVVRFFSLPVAEFAHFAGSLIGLTLLVLARGLQLRLDAAYHATLGFLATGAILALLNGFDLNEAVLLILLILALLPARQEFYRKTSLTSERFSVGWISAVGIVLLCSVWLGFFAYRHVEYTNALWWQFSLEGNAPRFLRASVGALALTFILTIAHLLAPVPPCPTSVTKQEIDHARDIVSRSPRTEAALALLGDKYLMFSQPGNAFLMYGIYRRAWVVMGDPVGPEGEIVELAWQFREMCDRASAWPVFYQVARHNLHIYLDLGLTLLKLGEEARVALKSFSLDGGSRKGLLHTYSRLERLGCRFEIVPPEGLDRLLPELREISEAWLLEKNVREKGFSLGYFDEEYLKNFPMALVWREGRIVAFANLWLGADKQEMSVDLMRFRPDAPPGVMDYLFAQLMLWGQAEGYLWFNLGMAPLSGLQDQSLAPLWNRLGALVFRHGEHFINFQGLRQYKAKFDPEWEPRYVAAPGGIAMPRILLHVAALISRGLTGIAAK